MDLRPLGSTGILVSPIGLGTVKVGRNTALKHPRPFDLPTDEQLDALLAAAHDLGVNLIDTAPAYGSSEQRLGDAMRRNNWFGSRHRWILSTKVGEEFDGNTSTHDFSPHAINASVHRSLIRLGVDHLDIVLLHSDGNDELILRQGALHTLQQLKHAGLVRAVGLSAKTPAGHALAIDLAADALMVHYSIHHTHERDTIALAHARSVGVLIKKALDSGLHATPATLHDQLAPVVALPGVSSVVVGTTNPIHLRQNVTAASRQPPLPPASPRPH